MITGANSSFGYETALAFAQAGSEVVIAVRNASNASPPRLAFEMAQPS